MAQKYIRFISRALSTNYTANQALAPCFISKKGTLDTCELPSRTPPGRNLVAASHRRYMRALELQRREEERQNKLRSAAEAKAERQQKWQAMAEEEKEVFVQEEKIAKKQEWIKKQVRLADRHMYVRCHAAEDIFIVPTTCSPMIY